MRYNKLHFFNDAHLLSVSIYEHRESALDPQVGRMRQFLKKTRNLVFEVVHYYRRLRKEVTL